jgi:hypothetical protein
MSEAHPHPLPQEELRHRIGWLCKLIRLAALAYAGWILFVVLRHWLDADVAIRTYGAWLRADLSGMTLWQRLVGLAIHFGIWILAALACFSVWRLFSGYLRGQIFTVDAAVWLGRIGSFGIAAELLDIATRPLVTGLVTLHLPAGQRHMAFSFNPNDLLILLFLIGFVALAHVFKTAAEIADDAAQIV